MFFANTNCFFRIPPVSNTGHSLPATAGILEASPTGRLRPNQKIGRASGGTFRSIGPVEAHSLQKNSVCQTVPNRRMEACPPQTGRQLAPDRQRTAPLAATRGTHRTPPGFTRGCTARIQPDYGTTFPMAAEPTPEREAPLQSVAGPRGGELQLRRSAMGGVVSVLLRWPDRSTT